MRTTGCRVGPPARGREKELMLGTTICGITICGITEFGITVSRIIGLPGTSADQQHGPRRPSRVDGWSRLWFALGCWIGGIAIAASASLAQIPNPEITANPSANPSAKLGVSEFDSAGEQIQAKFSAEMEAIAERCDQLDRPQLAQRTRQWIARRDPTRQYLFWPPSDYRDPPATNDAPLSAPVVDSNDTVPAHDSVFDFWRNKVQQLRQAYAVELQAMALEAAERGDVLACNDWLWKGLQQDPDNAVIRRVLGFEKVANGWADSSLQRFSAKRARRPEAFLKWRSGEYIEAASSNFRLVTNASAEDALPMLRRMQTWRFFWRQVCLPYFADADALTLAIKTEREIAGGNQRPHDVVLFATRQDFLAALSHVTGIERSTGYYDPELRRSFFYLDSTQDLNSTWRHETVHQLFQETGRRTSQPGEKANLWLVEGIAMYFESLRWCGGDPGSIDRHFAEKDFAEKLPHVWSLGGFEAQRLQYARIRWQREGFFSPLTELVSKSRSQLQADPEIVRLYAQAGGFTHFLMQAEIAPGHNRQAAVFQMLAQVYAGRDRADLLSSVADCEVTLLEQQYQQWLSFAAAQTPDPMRWAAYNQELALGYSDVDDTILAGLHAPDLFLLQLSATQITDQSANTIARHSNLQQLFLDKTKIGDATLAQLVPRLPKLQSLDLAGTEITDQTVARLPQLPLLERVWLSGTSITDASVPALLSLDHLELLDVRGTAITAAGKAKLSAKIKEVLQ